MRRAGGAASARWRMCGAATVAGLALLTGCTASGTGDPESPPATTAASAPEETPSSEAPSSEAPTAALPVTGAFVVDGTDTGSPVRFAVHAVRRVPGGSVLDYSLTALPTPGAAVGEPIVGEVDLDFDGFVNGPNVNLVDVAGARVYRPLADAAGACVCTAVNERGLVVGETQLHQAAYPSLPPTLTEITVEFGNGPLVQQVPVLAEGQVPTVAEQVDLAMPADDLPLVASTRRFRYPVDAPFDTDPDRQPLRVELNRVVSGAGGTTIVWTIVATGKGAGLTTEGTPITDYPLAPVTVAYKSGVASGPGLRPAGVRESPVSRAWFATIKAKGASAATGVKPADWRYCLCTDYQYFGDGVDSPGERRTFVTHLPPLADGVDEVDVVFPDRSLPPLTGVPVDPAAGSGLGEPEPADVGTWTSAANGIPRQAFTADEWPTPVPDTASLKRIRPVVDDLLLKQTIPAAQREQQEKRVEITLDSTISFEPDSARLTETARDGIAAIADQISAEAKAGSVVRVEGHVAGTDQGSVSFQMRLSRDRAKGVYAALRPQVDADVTFAVAGYGAARPVAPNDTEANRRLNRRVVVTFRK